jgi:hypothetical protein
VNAYLYRFTQDLGFADNILCLLGRDDFHPSAKAKVGQKLAAALL